MFMGVEKAFHGEPKKLLELVMHQKGMQYVLLGTVINLHKRANARLKVELSNEFDVVVGMHQGSVFLSSWNCG